MNIGKLRRECPPEEIDELMCEVERLAVAQDLAALRKYSFIYIGETCHRRGREANATNAA
jgi:hypothetical protein